MNRHYGSYTLLGKRVVLLCVGVLVAFSAMPVSAANRYALVIASGDFATSSPYYSYRIPGPHTDARLMISLLLWRFRIKPENIRVLGLSRAERQEITQGIDHELQNGGDHATYNNIENGFQWLADVSHDRADTVIVYYAGHGTRVANMVNPTDFNSEALVPYDAVVGATMVLDIQIKTWLQAITSRRKTVIVDSCFSGDMIREIEMDRALTSRSLPSHLPLSRASGFARKPLEASLPAGTVLLAACSKVQTAHEKRLDHGEVGQKPRSVGVFTWALYYVLCHVQENPTCDDLMARVTARLAELKVDQKPVLLGTNESTVAIAPVNWPAAGPRVPVVQQTSTDFMLDVGWFAGLTNSTVLSAQAGGKILPVWYVDWFRARTRGTVPMVDNYITVQQFPAEAR